MASLLRDLSTTVATQFAGLALGILTSVIINRALLPEGKGALAIWLVTIELGVALSCMGLPKGVVYEIGRAQDRTKLVATAQTVAIANGLFVGLLALILMQLPTVKPFADGPTAALGLTVLTAVATAVLTYLEAILRGLNEIWTTNKGSLLRRVAYFGGSLALLAWDRISLETVMLAFLASALAAITYFSWVLKRVSAGFAFSTCTLRSLFRYGLRYQGFALVNRLHARVDILIVSFLLTKQDVGCYSTAVNFAQILWNLPTAVSFVLVPYVARRRPGDDASVRTAQVTRIGTLVLVGGSLGLFLFVPWLLPFLYSEAFRPAVTPLRILLPGIVAFSIVRILGAHLTGRGRLTELTLLSSIILAVNVALNLWLIPLYGVNGSALASTMSYAANAVLVAWLVSREGHVRTLQFLLPRLDDLATLRHALSRAIHARRGLVRVNEEGMP